MTMIPRVLPACMNFILHPRHVLRFVLYLVMWSEPRVNSKRSNRGLSSFECQFRVELNQMESRIVSRECVDEMMPSSLRFERRLCPVEEQRWRTGEHVSQHFARSCLYSELMLLLAMLTLQRTVLRPTVLIFLYRHSFCTRMWFCNFVCWHSPNTLSFTSFLVSTSALLSANDFHAHEYMLA